MKGSGKIGFWFDDVEVAPSVYRSKIVEKPYAFEIDRDIRKNDNVPDQQNDNLNINNKISIVTDLYIQKHWPSVKYVLWNGVRWKVKSIDLTPYPRIYIELGGIYNGQTTT